MTIMDELNKIVTAEGGTPSGGSIVDVLNAAAVAKGGQPVGGSIADAIANYEAAKDSSGNENTEPDPDSDPKNP